MGRSHNTQPIFTIFKEHFLQARAKLFFPPLVSVIVAPSGEIHVPGLSSMRINILSINHYFIIAKKIPDVLSGGARQQRGAAFRRRLPSAPSIHWARRTRTVPRRRRLSVGNTQFADESLLSVREDGNFPPLDVEADHRGWSTLG